jgi:hypothetical protein
MSGQRERLIAWVGAAFVTPLIFNDGPPSWFDVGMFLFVGIVLHALLNVSLISTDGRVGTMVIAAAAGVSLFAPMPDIDQPSWLVRFEAFVVCLFVVPVIAVFWLVVLETIREWWQLRRYYQPRRPNGLPITSSARRGLTQ